MNAGLLLGLVFLLFLGAAIYLFRLALNRSASEKIMLRLAEGQPEVETRKPGLERVNRAFLRAGLNLPTKGLSIGVLIWALFIVIGLLTDSMPGIVLGVLGPPLALRMFISWRYRKRVARMIEQLPQMLDHTVRSLKSGRTLSDAVLNGIEASNQPLKGGMSRIQRNVQLGVSLPEATRDFAELYERDEFRLFAMGLKVNHRYGGNASELLENLIRLIREREQAVRQLKAMTGETRMTAVVLALLPVGMAGYFLLTNPNYLMHMWHDDSGQMMLMVAFTMQLLGCLALWRMLRSI
ncbi:type II secretion system F family protein [Pseudomonas syringae]|uniref:Type II secretion system protein F n=1 Tax=Pseudomonas syringae TaxID=317 RepID=A0A085V900_PSESX|nr:type II secretion system F family protein [Pseudomonas syringae]KFE51913.1 type II secretion system protein F [Pseudomonas syringae]